ncbi:hypothetical protein G7Y89_g8112 [Cudoniella acicularis]|uniref:Uncharacterized protein n=1 Tax=Cudoniella acicularis TaxID=354080 RepID=A0A8H4W359_9HELO|nr:hypothetical protein G7Y89_g8112 [Cudoniella acicularis]
MEHIALSSLLRQDNKGKWPILARAIIRGYQRDELSQREIVKKTGVPRRTIRCTLNQESSRRHVDCHLNASERFLGSKPLQELFDENCATQATDATLRPPTLYITQASQETISSDEATFKAGKSGRIWVTRRINEKRCSSCIRSIGLVQQILQGAEDQLKVGTLDTDDDGLVDTLKASKKKAKLLESISKGVAPAAETLRLDRYQAAVRTQGKDRVEVALLGLLGGANDLVEDELIKATAGQAKALCDAVEELSATESFVSEDGKAGFFHSGSGDMINDTGPGTQNINKGRGTQNIAKSIKIGK